MALTLIQWNCRSLSTNRTPLQQWLLTQTTLPHFLLLQETRHVKNIPGYRALHSNPAAPLSSIYIRRDIAYEQEDVPSTLLPYVTALSFYPDPPHPPLTLVNIYNPPNCTALFAPLFHFLRSFPQHRDILLGGDFNAPNTIWGYSNTLRSGRLLHAHTMQHSYTLINTPDTPTRDGHATQRHTTPDLTFHHGSNPPETWQVLPDTLLSDHHIIQITLTLTHKPKKRVITQTNWDRFRLLRARETTTNYDLWIGSLRRTRSQTTTTIEADTPSDHPDPHLMRLWRRRKRLLSRIRIQPRNTQLRQKLDTLNTDILVHCSTLETTNWNRICDSMNSSLHTKSPWFLLRSLLGPQSAPLPTLQKHLSLHGAASLIQQVTDLYIPLHSFLSTLSTQALQIAIWTAPSHYPSLNVLWRKTRQEPLRAQTSSPTPS